MPKTLIEVMIVLSLIALVGGLGMQSFSSTTKTTARISADKLETALQTAQALALEKGSASLCPQNSWSQGAYILESDAKIHAQFTFPYPKKILITRRSIKPYSCLKFTTNSQKSANNTTFEIYAKKSLLKPIVFVILSKEGRIRQVMGQP